MQKDLQKAQCLTYLCTVNRELQLPTNRIPLLYPWYRKETQY